jgi:hypothetical protein
MPVAGPESQGAFAEMVGVPKPKARPKSEGKGPSVSLDMSASSAFTLPRSVTPVQHHPITTHKPWLRNAIKPWETFFCEKSHAALVEATKVVHNDDEWSVTYQACREENRISDIKTLMRLIYAQTSKINKNRAVYVRPSAERTTGHRSQRRGKEAFQAVDAKSASES